MKDLNDFEHRIKNVAQQLEEISNKFIKITNDLDKDIYYRDGLEYQTHSLSAELNKAEDKVYCLGHFIKSSVEEYNEAESQLSSQVSRLLAKDEIINFNNENLDTTRINNTSDKFSFLFGDKIIKSCIEHLVSFFNNIGQKTNNQRLQEDSYRGDDLNLYSYVQNSINLIDPTEYYNEKGTGDKLLTEDEFYKLTKKIIDSAEGRPYTYTPKEWENEFQNNITPMIEMIPNELADSQRQPLVDAIIISEAQKLQGKYGTVYHASNNIISKYITERGLHQSLEPLFNQYPTKDKQMNGLLKAFLEGFSSGFKVGIIQGAMDWGATYNKGPTSIKVNTGAYNPDLSVEIGNGLGKLNGKSIKVSKKGLDLVKNHLNRFGDIPENQAMVKRIENALANGQPITGADASFYMHEAAEATMMQKGIAYKAAHEAVLQKYNVSPYSVYHPEVIQQFSEWFNQGFKNFWGLK